MGGEFPPLNVSQVETILKNAGFTDKNTVGSHTQWEGYFGGQRRIVTVDCHGSKKTQFSHDIMKNMISQSRMNKQQFYSHLK